RPRGSCQCPYHRSGCLPCLFSSTSREVSAVRGASAARRLALLLDVPLELLAELLDETLDLLELRPVLALPLGDELLGVRTVPGLVGRLDLGVDVVDDAVELLVEVLPLRQLALDRLEVHSEPSHCVL